MPQTQIVAVQKDGGTKSSVHVEEHGKLGSRLSKFVPTPPAPVDTTAMKTWRADYMGLMEQWEIALLKALSDPMEMFRPPSVVSDDNPFYNVAFSPPLMALSDQALPFSAIPTGVRINSGTISGTDISGSKMRRFNYTPTSGLANATVTMSGATTFWVWADPLDVAYPIKLSMGPSQSAITTGVYGPWTCGISSADSNSTGAWNPAFQSAYANYGWTNNPLLQPNNWYQGDGNTVANGVPNNGNFYDLQPAIIGSNYFATLTESASTIYFVNNCRLTVEAADATAFVGISMLTRDVAQSFNRLYDRIDNPSTGSYGNCNNYVSCESAEAVWSSDKWEQCRFGASLTGDGFVPPLLPSSGTWGTTQAGCVYQWYSLNRALGNGWPVIQVQVGDGGTGTPAVDFSIQLEVRLCVSPLWIGPNNCGLNYITAPFTMPDWFSSSRAHGRLLGSSKKKIAISGGYSDVQPRLYHALTLHPGNVPTIGAMQRLALSSPPGSSGHKSVLSRIKDATSDAVVAAQNVFTLKRAWDWLKSSAGKFAGNAGKLAARAGPLIEEVAEEAGPVVLRLL